MTESVQYNLGAIRTAMVSRTVNNNLPLMVSLTPCGRVQFIARLSQCRQALPPKVMVFGQLRADLYPGAYRSIYLDTDGAPPKLDVKLTP